MANLCKGKNILSVYKNDMTDPIWVRHVPRDFFENDLLLFLIHNPQKGISNSRGRENSKNKINPNKEKSLSWTITDIPSSFIAGSGSELPCG